MMVWRFDTELFPHIELVEMELVEMELVEMSRK
jgi:hypothetical protein